MTFARPFDISVQPDPDTGLYDSKTLAQALGVKSATIRTMRIRGQVPEPTSMVGGAAIWTKKSIYDFFDLEDIDGEKRLKGLPPVNQRLPKVIDLFSGCGGLSLGFQKAGFDVLAGYDNWGCAVDTYRANMGHEAHLLDLSNVDETITSLQDLFRGIDEAPAIIGGPPCQDFSSAGKRQEGDRADLTEKYAAIVAHFRPPFFVMENVARAAHAAAFKRACSMLEDAGYFVKALVIDSSRIGVPQIRKRLITIGTKSRTLTEDIYEALVNGQSEHRTTVREYFENELDIKLDVSHYYRHPRSYARRAIFSIDEPSPTIRGVNRPIPAGYLGHPGDTGPVESSRPLTTQERALIQTFPRDFKWVGSRTNVEQMIGNAVPVGLGEFIGKSIASNIVT